MNKLLIAVLAGAPLFAAGEALPKGDVLMDKYVEATGGKAAHQKIKSVVLTGTVNIPAQGLKATIADYLGESNKRYQVMEIPGVGKFEEGFDGAVAWQRSAAMGPRIKDGEEKAIALRGSLGKDVRWRDIYDKADTVGSEVVDGKDCYKVVLASKVGKPETRYFDKASGLIVKVVAIRTTQMGEITSESVFSDYKATDGVTSPRTVNTKAAGHEMVIAFDSVKYNEPIPEDKFNLPPDIQALVNKGK